MTTQTLCDRCRNVGKYASVTWFSYGYAHEYTVKKDLCKACFENRFPEWVEKEHEGII